MACRRHHPRKDQLNGQQQALGLRQPVDPDRALHSRLAGCGKMQFWVLIAALDDW
jgi:hypothetical protein